MLHLLLLTGCSTTLTNNCLKGLQDLGPHDSVNGSSTPVEHLSMFDGMWIEFAGVGTATIHPDEATATAHYFEDRPNCYGSRSPRLASQGEADFVMDGVTYRGSVGRDDNEGYREAGFEVEPDTPVGDWMEARILEAYQPEGRFGYGRMGINMSFEQASVSGYFEVPNGEVQYGPSKVPAFTLDYTTSSTP